jgi:hypothetical protein
MGWSAVEREIKTENFFFAEEKRKERKDVMGMDAGVVWK